MHLYNSLLRLIFRTDKNAKALNFVYNEHREIKLKVFNNID